MTFSLICIPYYLIEKYGLISADDFIINDCCSLRIDALITKRIQVKAWNFDL